MNLLKLDELMEKEPRLREFRDRVISVQEGYIAKLGEDHSNLCHEDKIIEFLDVSMGEIFNRMGSEGFHSLVALLNTSFESWGDGTESVATGVDSFLGRLSQNMDMFDQPYFAMCLDKCVQIGVEDYEKRGKRTQTRAYFRSLYPDILLKLPTVLAEAEKGLSESQMNQLLTYAKQGWGDEAPSFIGGLEHLPDVLKLEGHDEAKDSLFFLLAKNCGSGHAGFNVIKSFCKLQEQLSAMQKPGLYSEIAERLDVIAQTRPYNLGILKADHDLGENGIGGKGRFPNFTGLPATLRAYENVGLDFLEVLDKVLTLYEDVDDLQLRTNIDHDHLLDPAFYFVMRYPEIHRIFQSYTNNTFLPLLKATRNQVSLDEIYGSAYRYIGKGLCDKVEPKKWLSFVHDEMDNARLDSTDHLYYHSWIPHGKSVDKGFLMGTVAAIEHGVPLEVYSRYMQQLSRGGLLAYTDRICPILNADIPEDERERLIDYHSVLRYVKDLPEYTNREGLLRKAVRACGGLKGHQASAEFDATEHWLRRVAKHVGVEYDNLIELLDTVVEAKIPAAKRLEAFLSEYHGEEKFIETCNDSHLNQLSEEIHNAAHLVEYFLEFLPKIFEYKFEPISAFRIAQNFGTWSFNANPKFYSDLTNSDRGLDDMIEITSMFRGQNKHEDSMRNLVFSDIPVDDIRHFYKEIADDRKLLSVHPPKTADAAWRREAHNVAEHFFEEQGIDLQYPKDFNIRVIACTQRAQARADLLRLARMESEGKHTKRLFQLGKVYGTEQVFGLTQRLDPVLATRLLVQGLISNRQERIDEALTYLPAVKLSKARAYLDGSHISQRQFYSLSAHDIKILSNSSSADEQRMHGQLLVKRIREMYLSSNSVSEGKTELRELVWLVEALYEGREIFDSITAKMQDGILKDLADGKRLLCCAMLSADREKEEIESLYYALDPYIGLMHIVPALASIFADPIGAAILANTRSYAENEVLLVDSVEGGVEFQEIDERTSFRLAATGILGAARDTGSEYVMFNISAPNGTSKRFNSHLERQLGAAPETVDLYKLRDRQTTQRPERYLEAFQNRTELAGPVTGYLVHTDALEMIAKRN